MFEDYYMPEFDADYYQGTAGIGGYDPYQFQDYSYLVPQEDVYANQRAEEERAYAEQVAAQAEAQRIAAEEEYFARVETERLAVARAQALEAEAERTQNEAVAARAEQARIAAEQAAAERVAAEQVAAQAQVQAQAAEQSRVQAEVAATVAPAPEPQPLAGIGRSVDENFYAPEVQAPEQIYAPSPEPVYTPAVEPMTTEVTPVAGIGSAAIAEPVYTPAAEPMTIEAEPVAGIGSPAVAAPAEAPSVIETAASTPAAGGPLTQEQYDAMADRRAAANAPPQGTYIAAPTDNLGKTTGFDTPGQAANTFQYRGGPIRVTDRKGKVLFSGEGPEGALEAVKFAQNLSDTEGKNASWDIQEGERTINPDGSVGPIRWVSGPTDAKEGMGLVGDLAAFALPIAAAILTAGMSLPAQMAISAAAGMVGGVMSGNDPLKAAIIAGVSVGVMDKIGANDFIAKALDGAGTAIGNVFASEVAQEGAKEVIKNAVAEFGEEIVVTAISQTMQGVANSIGNTLLSEVAKGAGLGDITGYQTPAEKFAEEQLPETLQTSAAPPVEDAIVVSGDRIGAVADTAADVITGIGSGAAADVADTELFADKPPADDTIVVSGKKVDPVADIVADVVSGIGSATATDAISGFETPSKKFVEEPLPEELKSDTQPPAEDTIVVTGTRATPAADVVTGIGGTVLANEVLEPIVVTGTKTEPAKKEPDDGTPGFIDPVTGDIVVSKEQPVTDSEESAPLTVTKDPGIDTGPIVTEPLPPMEPDPALTDEDGIDVKDVIDVVTTVAPVITGGGGGDGGGTLPPDTTGIDFTETKLRPTITGRGIGGKYPYTPQTYGRMGGDQETEYLFFTKDPVTGKVTAEPAGTVNPATIPVKKEGGEIEDDMVKHLVEYHKNGGHQGPGQVKGIGSGQEDKIPAWLSDGEYVWSAQDVSDLGDGSNKEGVRRLDKMRQMVRRQAGRKDVKKIAKPQKGIDTMLKAVGGMV
jgi:hypothetical protein